MVNAPRIVIAGTHSGVGKTTAATGLMAAFASRGLKVAPFKAGPDFIDPSYHALAAGRPGRNLDAYLSGPELIAPLFAHGARGADVAVIEGVMGLFDGKGSGEQASTAHVAKLLGAPVVLVLDARAMARSAAALLHGFMTFDNEVRVAGVILNRVGSGRHEDILREAIAPLGIPVLGVLRRDPDLSAPSRHLGLIPAAEREREARQMVKQLGAAITTSCNLDEILRLARSAEPLVTEPWEPRSLIEAGPPASVAVAGGPAFSFRYPENLELLEAAGAQLSFFDPASEESLPADTDALYLGGGFPEAYAAELSANEPLKQSVRELVRAGRPALAECGGLLYLSRDLDGAPMCGVLNTRSRMTDRLTLGYREARALADSPVAEEGTNVRGHEFHYSAIEPVAEKTPAWEFGDGRIEGFISGNVHASYLHTHWASMPRIPAHFVRQALEVRA